MACVSGNLAAGHVRPSAGTCIAQVSPSWMCKNLHLGWPLDGIVKPEVSKTDLATVKWVQRPAAQPGMLKSLEDEMESAVEASDPTWLARISGNLAAGNVRP